MKYLHIGQHWSRTVIQNGVTYKLSRPLINLKQLEDLKGTPIETRYEIKNSNHPQWGMEVYAIDENNNLQFVTAHYDTSG